MKHLKHNLQAIKTLGNGINPDPVWVETSRARLLSQISNTVVPVEKPVVVDTARAFWFQFQSSAAMRAVRPALTALGVAALATGGWIASVSASVNSLPGDRLWAVKRVAQNTELAVRSFGATQDEKVHLQLNLAKNRTNDIKKAFTEKLSPEASPKDREKAVKDLSVAVKDVQLAVREVSVNVTDQVKENGKTKTLESVETVKGVAKDTTEIAKSLASTVSVSASSGAEVTKQVLETVKVVNQTGINAVEAVVKDHSGLAESGESNNVKNIVSEKVVDLVQSTEALKNDLKNSLGIATPAIKTDTATTLVLTVPTATGTAVVSLPLAAEVKQISKTLPESPSSSANLIKDAEQKTADIHQSAVEIKKSIDSGDLQDAVNRLKDLNETVVITQQQLVENKTNTTQLPK